MWTITKLFGVRIILSLLFDLHLDGQILYFFNVIHIFKIHSFINRVDANLYTPDWSPYCGFAAYPCFECNVRPDFPTESGPAFESSERMNIFVHLTGNAIITRLYGSSTSFELWNKIRHSLLLLTSRKVWWYVSDFCYQLRELNRMYLKITDSKDEFIKLCK